MAVAGASGRAEQIVPAILLQNLRPLADAQRRALVKMLALSNKPALFCVKLLNDRACKAGVFQPPVEQHVQKVVPSVVIVEQGRVKTAGGDESRLAPRAGDGRGRDDVVQGILEGGGAFHVGVHQPEQPVRIGEVRGPQAAGVVVALQMAGHLLGVLQGCSDPLPVDKVGGVVDINARPPLKGGGGDVVVPAHLQDAGIRVEPRQDGVWDGLTHR